MKAMVVDGYIQYVSENIGNRNITNMEYESILAIIQNAPTPPSGYTYKLRASDLEWELVELPPEPPDPDPEVTDEEALEILLGGAES